MENNENDLQDGPIPVWKMFNDPMTALFKNLEHAEDGLFNLMLSIINSNRDFAEILIPHSTKCEQQKQYIAFNKWLLGRLFYILAVDKLERIHQTSISAQLKILSIFFINEAPFCGDICKEYESSLHVLIKFYNEIDEAESQTITLGILTPDEIEALAAELDLTPMPINICRKCTAKYLIRYLIEILGQIVISTKDLPSFVDCDEIFNDVFFVLKNFDYDLKIVAIEAFSKILLHFGYSICSEMVYTFLSLIEQLVLNIPILINNVNLLHTQIKTLNKELARLFATVRTLGKSSRTDINVVILNICKFILNIDGNYAENKSFYDETNAFDPALKLQCSKVIESFYDSNVSIVYEEFNVKYYIETMPSLLFCILSSEMKEHMNFATDERKICIDLYDNSKMFRRLLSILVISLQSACCDSIDICIINTHLENTSNILDILHKFTIECHNKYQQYDGTFINVFENKHNNAVLKDGILKTRQFLELKCIPHNKSNIIINCLADILKKINSRNEDLMQEAVKCMEIAMLVLLLSPEMSLGNLFTLLQIEGFSYCNNSIKLDDLPHTFFSNEHHQKIHMCTLRILLVQNLSMNFILDDDTWKNVILKLSHHLKTDLCTPKTNIEIVKLTPLMLLNKITTPHELITNFLHPAFLSKDLDLINTLIRILPVIVCITWSHYVVFQSRNDDNNENFEYKLGSVAGLYYGVICLHCHRRSSTAVSLRRLIKSEIKERKMMILMDKSQPFRSKSDAMLKNMRSLFENFLHAKLYKNGNSASVSKLIWMFVKHSMLVMSAVDHLISENNLTNISEIFDQFLTDVLNDNNLDVELKNHILQRSIDVLMKITKKSLETNNINQQDMCLGAILHFGLAQSELVLLPCIKLLMFYLMHTISPFGSKAAYYIRDVCTSHSMSPNKVYHRYKKDLCKIIMELTAYNYLLGHSFLSSIMKVIRAFGFIGYKEFVSKDIHHAVPYLIPAVAKSEKLKPIISEISSLTHCSPESFISERFPHIYTHIYIYELDETAEKCYQFIENITNSKVAVLVKKHSRVILTEFLLQYSCNPERVIKACRWLANMDPKFSPTSPDLSIPLSQVVSYIQPKFLGVLAYFDNKLVHTNVALSVKRKALQSFPHILNLMGPTHMTPLRFKMLATLRTALTSISEFPSLNAEAWNAFIRNIDTIVLGSLLPTIFVSLLPLLPHAFNKVNDIFEYLILGNENLLSNCIPDLFFLEETDVSSKIKDIVSKHVAKKLPDTFIEKIKWYMKYLNQDTAEIKIYSLKYLHKLIKDNRRELDALIFGSKNINSSIIELLEILVTGCKDKDNQLADWSGQCLGQLGALQPSLVPQDLNASLNEIPFAFTVRDICFAKLALTELTRAFQYEKHTKNMDCYSLAIQEILNSFNISPSGQNKEVWDSFPDHMHQIMLPLLSSRYNLASPINPPKIHPLFGSNQAATFAEWAFNWTGQLIPLVDSSTQEMLQMVYPALKIDLRTLVLFMPYILLHAISSDNDTTLIKKEIVAIIGLESFSNESSNKIESPKVRIMRSLNLSPIMTPLKTEKGTHVKCCKMIYNLLDFLNRWLREWYHADKKQPHDNRHAKIKAFLNNFCKLVIAQGNFLCGELERALLYLELYMEESPERLQEQLGFLAEIYTVLNEPDAIAGIMSMKTSEPSLSELILAHEVTGQLQDAATCYEKYAQQGDIDSERLQGMVEVYLGLDQPFTALKLLQGVDGIDPVGEAMAAEPFWRLAMFDDLDKLLKQPEISNDDRWGVTVGHCLLALRGGMRETLQEKLKAARDALIRRLDRGIGYTSAEGNIYSRSYSFALGLHMIAEIDHTEDMIYRIKGLHDSDSDCVNIIDGLIEDWNLRLKFVQSSAKTIEPVLRIRRILLEQSKALLETSHPKTASLLDMHIGKLWIQSAKLARKASIFQQAYIYILNGEKYTPKELFIEKAKLYWMRGQQEPAFCSLKRGLEEHFSDLANLSPNDRKLCAKAKLLIAMYNDETTNVDMDVNISHYEEAVKVYRHWEKSLVCLGGYFEKAFAAARPDKKKNSDGITDQVRALECYGRALQYGHSRLYQSMPRMLTIWLDFEISAENKNISMKTLSNICSIIETFTERLPLYLFLSAFSQIISRICHPIREVYNQLKSIIVKLILAYPQHSLWMMMCVIKSSYPQRSKRCEEILNDPRLKIPAMQTFITDFNMLAERFIELCNKPITENIQTTHVSTLVRSLPKMLKSADFSKIMMPHEKFVKIVLPFNSIKTGDEFNYVPFPSLVYIADIEDRITILQSLQKPRKVTLIGSDGKKYIIMLKPKDDIRKDFRLMEFNAVVNRYLQESPEARERRLYIRTYTVLPLNEECGLIQWIPNLIGLRPILLQIYREKGLYMPTKELRKLVCNISDSISTKQNVFENQLIKKHPAVFGEWFRYTFPDPHTWYKARSAYIRTTAVMSMVGYILGLGDRHGENILFDSTNGDSVHVDFSCLFNKGEELEWPEKVPFRLTHNMQAAMGPLRHEGMYRKCCEITLRVLRAQTTTLMSAIRPFVYDPLVVWQRHSARSDLIIGERTNQSARDHLANIEQRLQGVVRVEKKQCSLSLSPEGQANSLILEAINVVNLCQMYIGWGAYL